MAMATLGTVAGITASALHCRHLGCLPHSASPAALRSTSAAPPVWTSSFTARRPVAPSSCSFVGLPLRPSLFGLPTPRPRRGLLIRAKVSMACTKRSRSRKAIARVSGFRKRMSTPTGRNVLRRRRAKGRKNLTPATNPSSGKYA